MWAAESAAPRPQTRATGPSYRLPRTASPRHPPARPPRRRRRQSQRAHPQTHQETDTASPAYQHLTRQRHVAQQRTDPRPPEPETDSQTSSPPTLPFIGASDAETSVSRRRRSSKPGSDTRPGRGTLRRVMTSALGAWFSSAGVCSLLPRVAGAPAARSHPVRGHVARTALRPCAVPALLDTNCVNLC